MNLVDLIEKPAWMADASCRGMDPSLFFAERGAPTATAKAVCAGCPVTAECLAYAINLGERNGVWGGLSERQRRKIRTRLNGGTPGPPTRRGHGAHGPKAQPIRHGTPSGYNLHRRSGENACDDCADAWRTYRRDIERARRAGHRKSST